MIKMMTHVALIWSLLGFKEAEAQNIKSEMLGMEGQEEVGEVVDSENKGFTGYKHMDRIDNWRLDGLWEDYKDPFKNDWEYSYPEDIPMGEHWNPELPTQRREGRYYSSGRYNDVWKWEFKPRKDKEGTEENNHTYKGHQEYFKHKQRGHMTEMEV